MSSPPRLEWSEWGTGNPTAPPSVIIPGVPGVIHVCTHVSVDMFDNGAAGFVVWLLNDGGVPLLGGFLSVSAVGDTSDRIVIPGLNLPGSRGNSMSVTFQGGSASQAISARMSGYDL